MEKKILLGCGILKKEINFLIEKNGWDLETRYLDSSLHIDFDKLYRGLNNSLVKLAHREKVVFYGACHPLIDRVIDQAKTSRTPGQNCVEILLGKKLFTEELTRGAFFLLEDWTKRWDYIMAKAFGPDKEIIADILQGEHKYFLALRTTCSGDFQKEVEVISKTYSLPLDWMDVSLDHLESVLEKTIFKSEGAN